MITLKSLYHRTRLRWRSLSPVIKIILFIFTAPVLSEDQDPQCPWFQDLRVPSSIKSRCQCARTPALLSVQCHDVEGSQLITLLTQRGKVENLELLYLNASRVTDANGLVPAGMFKDVKIVSLQLSGCGIKGLHPEAFRGQEVTLKHLSLTQNQLKEVPRVALASLENLTLLDLSHNRITQVPNSCFEPLGKLTTLKLNDNNLLVDSAAFKGLEKSLKNLNLKGTRLTQVPEALANLSSLTFLDLAQNRIRDLDPTRFMNLNSLTALNLERNLLQLVPNVVFAGINDTLSSLSLLNNLLTRYPREALEYLKELRVLDLGFNLLTEIPNNAFEGLGKLTLLAVDGNPLSTLPAKPFAPLNKTLRGLSLGGRFLNCDCRISWIADWVVKFDLQITSRERNPQFCGNPPALRRLNFYQMKQDDFHCEPNMTSSISTITTTFSRGRIDKSKKPEPATKILEPLKPPVDISDDLGRGQIEYSQDSVEENPIYPPFSGSPDSTSLEESEDFYEDVIQEAESKSSTSKPLNHTSAVLVTKKVSAMLPKTVVSTTSSTSTVVSFGNNGKSPVQSTSTAAPETTSVKGIFDFDESKIPIITGLGPRLRTGSVIQVRVTPAPATGSSRRSKSPTTSSTPSTTPLDFLFPESSDIVISDLEWFGESVLVQWESSKQTSFRIIYRIFGEDTFRHGPPLAPNEREYRIQNVPLKECIIICVVPFEEIVYNEISPSSAVPAGSQCRELKPASPSALMSHMDKVTIGASVVIVLAVVLAVLIFFTATRRARNRMESPIMTKIPPGSFSTPSPGPLPILPQGSLTMTKECEWDQLSAISTRSIPRARVYSMAMDGIPRNVISGQHHHHHRSYLHGHNDHHHSGVPSSGSSYMNQRSRLIRSNLAQNQHQASSSSQKPSSNRSSNLTDHTNPKRRTRHTTRSNCDSLNTLSGYDTPDNWTDHDIDVYVAQNPTRRELVKL